VKHGTFNMIPKANDNICNGNTTKESSHVQITNEDNAYHFLLYHFEFIPEAQTVNQAYYVQILKQLH